MEKQLSFVLKLSLQEMAMRKVVINLWNENDILTLIVNFRINALPGNDFAKQIQYIGKRGTLNKELLQILENEVKNKVARLGLPESLKEQMMRIIKPIGLQLLKWKRSFHEKNIIESPEEFDVDILKQLHWTSVGVVDYRKTAENLVRHEMFDVAKRYRLACLYSLADYIPDLWEELPEEYKALFYSDIVISSNLELLLTSYWAYIVQARESELRSIIVIRLGEEMSYHRYAFHCAALEGNKATTEHFFQKLTQEERDSQFLRTVRKIMRKGLRYLYEEFQDFPMEKLSDVLSYLLCSMSPEDQMQEINEDPCDILACFLDWPWHDLCLDNAVLTWTFFSKHLYYFLVVIIIRNIKYSGGYFPEWFQKFFVGSPVDLKKMFIFYEIESGSWFSVLFDAEDTESIEIVFRNISVRERMVLLSCGRFIRHLDSLVMTEKWHLIKACLRAAAPSKEEKDRLKNTYMAFLTRVVSRNKSWMEYRKHQWERFFELLNTDASALNEEKVITDQSLGN